LSVHFRCQANTSSRSDVAVPYASLLPSCHHDAEMGQLIVLLAKLTPDQNCGSPRGASSIFDPKNPGKGSASSSKPGEGGVSFPGTKLTLAM